MNLQVDLLVDTDRRSASVLNAKALGRIMAITIPVLMLLTVGTTVVRLMLLKNELSMLEEQWGNVAPKQKEATQMQLQFMANRDMQKELGGWREARLEWNAILTEIRGVIPATIRLEAMNISHDTPLIDRKTAARAFRLFLRGKATGATSERDIPNLRRALEKLDPIASAEVTRFGADMTPSADRFDRVFQIDCVFHPRLFK